MTQNRIHCAHLREREHLAHQPACLGLREKRSHSHRDVCCCLLMALSPLNTHSPGLVPHQQCTVFILATIWLPISHTYWEKESWPKASRTCFLASECSHNNQITTHYTNTHTSTGVYTGNTGEGLSIECTYLCDSLHANKVSSPCSGLEPGKGPDNSDFSAAVSSSQRVCLTTVGSCIIPDCPGGGAPDDPLGRHRNTVRTAALFPAQGSMAIGLGAP